MSAAIRIPSLYLIATTDVPVTYGFLNKQKGVKNPFFFLHKIYVVKDNKPNPNQGPNPTSTWCASKVL